MPIRIEMEVDMENTMTYHVLDAQRASGGPRGEIYLDVICSPVQSVPPRPDQRKLQAWLG